MQGGVGKSRTAGKCSPKLPYPRPLDYGVGSHEEDCEGFYSHANVLAMNSGNMHP